jgi:hypothetical protein
LEHGKAHKSAARKLAARHVAGYLLELSQFQTSRLVRINQEAAGHPTEAIGVLIGHRSPTDHAASETDIESCPMATRGAGRAGYYKTQPKFVRHDYPFGDDTRFRKGLPSLKDILVALKDRYAKDAFDKLVRLKVDPEEIGNLLRMIGVSSDEPIAAKTKAPRSKCGAYGSDRTEQSADRARIKSDLGERV